MSPIPVDATALVVTATPSGEHLGLRLDVGERGITVGYREDDFEVEGAEQAGSRVQIVRSDDAPPGEWIAKGFGRVTHNGVVFGTRALSAGDAIRVEDTFFRFICGTDIDNQYYETIYYITIVDFSTETHNARYLLEALDNELRRARSAGSMVVVATIQFEREAASTAASHDILGSVAGALRRSLSREQVVARSGDLEITVLSPNSSPPAVEGALRAAVQPLGNRTAKMRLGLAESQPGTDPSGLLARSRANARSWPD